MPTERLPDAVQEALSMGQAIVRYENETMQAFAIQTPRPRLAELQSAMIEELQASPEYAEKMYYVLPYKEQSGDDDSRTTNVEGIGVKGAMFLQRLYRNCTSGGRVIADDNDRAAVQGVFIDYETNTRVAREWLVPRSRWSKKLRQMVRVNERMFQQMLKAEMSKAQRNAVLASLPFGLTASLLKEAKALIANPVVKKGEKATPLPERVKAMFAKMEEIGASKEQVLSFLKVKEAQLTVEHIVKMVGVYNALMDGEGKFDDYFGPKTNGKSEEEEEKDILEALNLPPEVAAVKEEKKVPEVIVDSLELAYDPTAQGEEDEEAKMYSEPKTRMSPEQAMENLVGELSRVFPELGKREKLGPAQRALLKEILKRAFGTDEWKKIEALSVEEIEEGLKRISLDITAVLTAKRKKA